MTQSSEQLEREAERQRAHLSATLDELRSRITPGQLVDQTLDYVRDGGTLLVQYNTGPTEFNEGHYTPYPSTLSRDRVTVEDAPVTLLQPENEVFHYPNQITQNDFAGWVQERGLYFMEPFDAKYTPLLLGLDTFRN